MKKVLLISIVLLGSGFSIGFNSNSNTTKITVCHVPPGNPGNCHEISVSGNALQAHLDHGDNLICSKQSEYSQYVEVYNQYIATHPYSKIELTRSFAE